jgi:hypothetical protein
MIERVLRLPLEVIQATDAFSLPLNESRYANYSFTNAAKIRYAWVTQEVAPWLATQRLNRISKVKKIHHYLTTNDPRIVGENIVEESKDIPGKFRSWLNGPVYISDLYDPDRSVPDSHVFPASTQVTGLMNKWEKGIKQRGKTSDANAAGCSIAAK